VAIDNRNRRASALGLLGMALVMPLADSTVDVGDRRHVTGVYRMTPITIEPTGFGSNEAFGNLTFVGDIFSAVSTSNYFTGFFSATYSNFFTDNYEA